MSKLRNDFEFIFGGEEDKKQEFKYVKFLKPNILIIVDEIVTDTFTEFFQLFKSLENDNNISECNIYIHSPGGDAFAGLSIIGLMQSSRLKTITYVCGYAASAAGMIAVSGDYRYIYDNAFYLIHEPSLESEATRTKEKQDEIKLLEFITKQEIKIFTSNSIVDECKMDEFLSRNTWLSSEEVLLYKIADEIVFPRKMKTFYKVKPLSESECKNNKKFWRKT